MRIRKRKLSNILAMILVVSLLASSGMIVSVSAAEANSVYQEEKIKLQKTETASESNAVKKEMKTKMLESRSGTEQTSETSGTCGENLTWELKDGVLMISGTGEMDKWPQGHTPWYDSKNDIKKIAICNGVTRIGISAFYDCSSLTNVELPSGLTSIGDSAFSDCSSLTSVELPSGLTNIEDFAFFSCSNLTNVKFPSSVTDIGDYAFNRCTTLTDVYYAGSKSDWANITIGEWNKPLTNATIHYNITGSDSITIGGNISINVESLRDAVLYVPYSAFIKLDNVPEGSQPVFRISGGTLPEGLQLNESTGEISGMPVKAGQFEITIEVVFSGSQDISSVNTELTIKVKENTDINIDSSSDEGYEVEQYVGDKTEQGYIMTQYTDQTFVSAGSFGEFIALWLNGQKLVEDEDYIKEDRKSVV